MRPFRTVALLVGVATALTACASSELAADPAAAGASDATTTLKVACTPTLMQLPRAISDARGLTDEAGIAEECVQVGSGPEVTAALVSGEVNVAFMSPAGLGPLLDKDQELVSVGSIWNHNTFDLLVREGYPLPSAGDGWEGVMRDLEGAKIGVVARGANAETIAKALFTEAGAAADRATYIATGGPATTVTALKTGAIDAGLTFQPGIALAKQEGIASSPFSLAAEDGPQFLDYADVLVVTTRDFAEGSGDAVCRYLESWDEGLEVMRAPENREEVASVAQAFFGLPGDTVDALLDDSLALFPETTELHAEHVDPGFAFMARSGVTAEQYSLEDVQAPVCA